MDEQLPAQLRAQILQARLNQGITNGVADQVNPEQQAMYEEQVRPQFTAGQMLPYEDPTSFTTAGSVDPRKVVGAVGMGVGGAGVGYGIGGGAAALRAMLAQARNKAMMAGGNDIAERLFGPQYLSQLSDKGKALGAAGVGGAIGLGQMLWNHVYGGGEKPAETPTAPPRNTLPGVQENQPSLKELMDELDRQNGKK